MAEELDSVPDEEQTLPPVSTLRYPSLDELFRQMPQITELVRTRPAADEEPISFLYRLRSSQTPEEAITFTAFAVQPKMAVWWGYECVRNVPKGLSASDRELMELIAAWASQPSQGARYAVMEAALFAPIRSPAVLLGLAVGWSGGQIAPNDPIPVSPQRTPRAINSAILSCLARVPITNRKIRLAQFIGLAESLFRVR